MEYQLSKQVVIKKTKEIVSKDSPIYDTDDSKYTIIFQKRRFYVVNESIKNFLMLFESPVSKEVVFEKIGVNEADEVYKENIDKLFKGMRARKILVPSNNNNESVPSTNLVLPENYELVKVLREKEESTVSLATNLITNEQVVIKSAKLEGKEGKTLAKLIDSYLQEFEILKEVNHHKNICKLLSFDKTNAVAVLEYIDGDNLSKFIVSEELDLKVKFNLITQLLNVFSFLHNAKIIHGDIHSSNFLVDKNVELKLIDFGLSNHEELTLNEVKKNGGSFNFIPPERISLSALSVLNSKKSNYQSEVYQLGLIMYLILYKTLPHLDYSWKNLVKKIVNEPVSCPALTPEGEEVPKAVILMIEKCLKKDFSERYVDATILYESWLKINSSLNENV